MKATCSSGRCFPKIVEWSFLQQGRTVWRKIPGKKRKPFVNRFTNKLRITEAMKNLEEQVSKDLEHFLIKKCQQARGEQWEERKGGSLCCCLSPSHRPPRAFIFLSPQPPHDTKGPLQRRRKGGRKDPKNEKAGSRVGSKIIRRD